MDKQNILVLCTGNSCRSQITEGFLRHLVGNQFDVYSAGTEPAEHTHPLAVKVMREAGIDISDQHPTNLKEYLGRKRFRYLLVVCSSADQTCPRIFPGVIERLYWPFDDPAAFKGSPEETVDEFRRVRDQIRDKLDDWLPTAVEA